MKKAFEKQKHLHCKQATLVQHHRNCRDNLKAVLRCLLKKGTIWQMHIDKECTAGAQSTLTILRCKVSSDTFITVQLSRLRRKKLLPYTHECIKKYTEHCMERRGRRGQLKSKRGRTYPPKLKHFMHYK